MRKRVRKERHLDRTAQPWADFEFHQRPGGLDLRVLRKNVLRLTQTQCAELLHVYRNTYQAWEAGRKPVPYMAYHLLRLVSENHQFSLRHPEWKGWCITRDGKLCDPDHLYEFTPDQLSGLWIRLQIVAHLELQVKQLHSALNAAQGENTELRSLFVNQGVVDEISNMRERINELMTRLNTAKVIPFPVAVDEAKKAVG